MLTSRKPRHFVELLDVRQAKKFIARPIRAIHRAHRLPERSGLPLDSFLRPDAFAGTGVESLSERAEQIEQRDGRRRTTKKPRLIQTHLLM